MTESPWYAAAASLLMVLAAAPILMGLGYLVYLAKTPRQKRHPAKFVSETVFLLAMLFAVGFMGFSGFLANLGDGVIDAVALLAGLLVFPLVMSIGTKRLLTRIGWGQPKPLNEE